MHNLKQTVLKKENIRIVVYVAIAIIGLIVLKKILENFGLFEKPEVKRARKQAEKAYKDSKDKILATQKPTKSDADWKRIADIIHEDLKRSAVDDSKNDAAYQVCRVQNDADLIRLADLFGIRREWWFGIPMSQMGFYEYVSSNLSRSKLDAINKNYQSKNIKFRW